MYFEKYNPTFLFAEPHLLYLNRINFIIKLIHLIIIEL